MQTNKIPPKATWKEMSINQLTDVRCTVMDTYYNLRAINASFAGQYLTVIAEIDALIVQRERDAAEEKESQG